MRQDALPGLYAFGLAPSASGQDRIIDLKWIDNSKLEAKYVIERSTSSNFTSNLLTREVSANTTSYRDTALQAKTTYYYRVFAVKADGTKSRPSNTASATTK